MTLGLPAPGAVVPDVWITALTNLMNALLQSKTYTANANLTPTATETAIPGCSASVTVAGDAAVALVIGTFDVATTTASSAVVVGRCQLDGVDQPATVGTEAHWNVALAARGTISQTWIIPLTAGTHTVQLTGLLATSAGSGYSINNKHTTMNIAVFDLV